MFHNVDIWRRALPANGDPMWSFWPFGQAWMCRNLFDRDKSYLARICPILRESARFCMDFLSDTEQGLAPSPATSPENCFLVNGKPTSVAQASENATAIVRTCSTTSSLPRRIWTTSMAMTKVWSRRQG